MTPQLLARTPQSFDLAGDSPRDAEEDAHVRIRRSGKAMAVGLLKRCARMLSTDWRILLWSEEAVETVIASHGPVQIRQSPGGCLAQTCVKGDITPARATALLRLAKYVNGDNRRAACLDAERPLLLQRKAPGLWQVAVRLTDVHDAQTAPAPRTRKITIVTQEPTTWAVVTQRGRPTDQALGRAELVIRDTIARSHWFAAGSATIRIHTPTSALPFVGSFEVAVLVVSHPRDTGRAPVSHPAHPPSPSVHELLSHTASSSRSRQRSTMSMSRL